VRLGELTDRLTGGRLIGDGGRAVAGITHDSRRVQENWIFAALPGQHAHGLEFLDGALANGACAVLTDRARPSGVDLPWIEARVPRRMMAEAAWLLAGNPQRELQMVGITGTNGKSTTTHLLSLIFEAGRRRGAFMGTLGYYLPSGERLSADRTTPEATDLAPLLRRTVADRGRVVAMEVSSHALMMERLAGLRFQVAVWTNLSRDHLDFHGDMESYFRAKRRLFEEHLAEDGRRVLPVDDEWCARLLEEPRATDVSWGLGRGTVHAREVRADLDGTAFELVLGDEVVQVRLPLIGVHNLRNALAAAAAGRAAGVGSDAIRRGLELARPLSGRLEPVADVRGCPVFVDYAHTPGGLHTVLEALREITDRRLIVVFGAGGDRDVGKRGPMGSAVGELADVALVTSDNPRSEDPARIAAAVAEGVRASGGQPLVELDRRRAIASALDLADERSLVLVAGKGHEATQTIGGQQLPFSDQSVILELIEGVRCA
jgi:UDP-N-acetylmuramoyl-L-alanyl-D-glutamate--2,6-diaminopimelate ligase